MTTANASERGDPREALLIDAFERWASRVNGFVLARCGDESLAADVTSEVFVAAARAIGGDRPEQVTLPWLLATARRRLIDQWRLQRTRSRTLAALVAQPHVDGGSTTVDRERVRRALDSLAGPQRVALTLRYLDEMSVSEVADVIDSSYRATESLLARARRSFEWAWGEL